jgi:sortase A
LRLAIAAAALLALWPAAAHAATCPWAAPPRAVANRLSPVGTLRIPAIGLRTPLYQGAWPGMSTEASLALMHGPAFYPQAMPWNNSLPGQGGTVGLAGHRTTRTHPFCLLGALKRGDLAIIRMRYGTYIYRLVGEATVTSSDWRPFRRPSAYDPDRDKAAEYLVTATCTPPRSAADRLAAIWRLVATRTNAAVR